MENPDLVNNVIPELLEYALSIAEEQSTKIIDNAIELINNEFDAEISRLKPLQSVNPNIKPEDIEALEAEQKELIGYAENAKTRLDALLIIKSDNT